MTDDVDPTLNLTDRIEADLNAYLIADERRLTTELARNQAAARDIRTRLYRVQHLLEGTKHRDRK
jgi:hypothetical protein